MTHLIHCWNYKFMNSYVLHPVKSYDPTHDHPPWLDVESLGHDRGRSIRPTGREDRDREGLNLQIPIMAPTYSTLVVGLNRQERLRHRRVKRKLARILMEVGCILTVYTLEDESADPRWGSRCIHRFQSGGDDIPLCSRAMWVCRHKEWLRLSGFIGVHSKFLSYIK